MMSIIITHAKKQLLSVLTTELNKSPLQVPQGSKVYFPEDILPSCQFNFNTNQLEMTFGDETVTCPYNLSGFTDVTDIYYNDSAKLYQDKRSIQIALKSVSDLKLQHLDKSEMSPDWLVWLGYFVSQENLQYTNDFRTTLWGKDHDYDLHVSLDEEYLQLSITGKGAKGLGKMGYAYMNEDKKLVHYTPETYKIKTSELGYFNVANFFKEIALFASHMNIKKRYNNHGYFDNKLLPISLLEDLLHNERIGLSKEHLLSVYYDALYDNYLDQHRNGYRATLPVNYQQYKGYINRKQQKVLSTLVDNDRLGLKVAKTIFTKGADDLLVEIPLTKGVLRFNYMLTPMNAISALGKAVGYATMGYKGNDGWDGLTLRLNEAITPTTIQAVSELDKLLANIDRIVDPEDREQVLEYLNLFRLDSEVSTLPYGPRKRLLMAPEINVIHVIAYLMVKQKA